MDEHVLLFPQRCCQGHGASSGDQRIPAAGSGGFVPRCWVETDGKGDGSATRANSSSGF